MNKNTYRPLFDRRLVIFIYAALLIFPIVLQASTDQQESEQIIEMDLKADPYASYKQRRTDWSKRISLGIENFLPEKFISPANQLSYLNTIGNTSMQMTVISVGSQYNTKIGGLYFDLIYAPGKITGSGTTIGATKTGASFGIFLDTIFENPYVSPYVSLQTFSLSWRDIDSINSVDSGGTISMMTSYQIGLAVHLDKVDPISSGAAYTEYGLKNSFLDIYGFQNMKSASSSDPDFSSSMTWGMNFRLEL